MEQLEQRLDLMEGQHRTEMQEMKNTVARLADKLNMSPEEVGSTSLQSTIPNEYQQEEGVLNDTIDIVSQGLVGESEWKELYALQVIPFLFPTMSCSKVVALIRTVELSLGSWMTRSIRPWTC